MANWTFLDATILSAHAHSPRGEPERPVPVHVSFVDWIPGICSLLGMIIINLIDKDRVRGDGDAAFGDARAVWRARSILFIGFALMAGGLAGSVVRPPHRPLLFRRETSRADFCCTMGCVCLQTVLVLKYILNDYPDQFLYYGYANVSQNVALMLSAIVLWIAQSGGSEYEYNLAI